MHEYLFWAVAWYLSGFVAGGLSLFHHWWKGRFITVGEIVALTAVSTLGPVFIGIVVGSEIQERAGTVVFWGRKVPEKSDDMHHWKEKNDGR